MTYEERIREQERLRCARKLEEAAEQFEDPSIHSSPREREWGKMFRSAARELRENFAG